MLSTLLSQLQGYFSKYFLLASFFPMLSFAVLNGLVGYLVFDGWHDWVDRNIFNAPTGTRATFVTTSLVVAVTLLAYVLSALGTFLRQVLEGRSWGAIGSLFVPAQARRRNRLDREAERLLAEIADLAPAESWQRSLAEARKAGKKAQGGISLSPAPVEAALTTLERRQLNFQLVKAAELEHAVDMIAVSLRNRDADTDGTLDRQHARVLQLIDYARQCAPALHVKLQNELNSSFGAQDVAPTKMGNVANSIQSYALRRYACNLEVIWSNLLRIVQKDEKAQAALQEAKTQLDFLVTYCWLTIVFAAVWTIVFGLVAQSRTAFLVSALAGPLLAYLWYRAAAEQYRSFADVAMTTLDTFRFDLLRDMRIHVPADVEDERVIWANVGKLATYGETANFRYDPPKS